jgi:hypothetical protein
MPPATRHVIAVDIDEVLARFVDAFCAYINSQWAAQNWAPPFLGGGSPTRPIAAADFTS